MMLPKVIYIMGMPGSGKGTQASLLAKEIGYYQFSTGDAFRSIAHEDSPLGRQVKETIDNGYLAPPEMAAEVVTHTIKGHTENSQGIIFDGTPRTMKEAQMVDDFFTERGYGRPLIIYLEVDKDAMPERNQKRKYCLGVPHGFPITDEEMEKKCAQIGGVAGMRPDDDPEKYKIRYSQFMELTYPVVQKYTQEGIVHTINGMETPEEVHQKISDIIATYELDKNSAGN